MQDDLISRSALLETIEKSRKAHASVRSRLTVGDMEQMIKGARSVDAEVVRHGRWKVANSEFNFPMDIDCSECGSMYNFIKKPNYCPNCGAKMKEKDN